MPGDCMRLIGATTLLMLASALSAQASDMPGRKPGLWKVKTTIANAGTAPRVVQQCIDAATDQMLQSSAGPYDAAACSARELHRAADSFTIDSICPVGGKSAAAHAVVTGSFDSAYTMTVTSRGEELPGGEMIMTMQGEWIGACAAGQIPGDVVMDNGIKINLPEMRKRALSPIDQPAAR